MKIDVKRLAELVKLELSTFEEIEISEYVEKAVQSVENLASFQQDVESFPHPASGEKMTLRNDVVEASVPRDTLLKNTPHVLDGYIVVPKTVH